MLACTNAVEYACLRGFRCLLTPSGKIFAGSKSALFFEALLVGVGGAGADADAGASLAYLDEVGVGGTVDTGIISDGLGVGRDSTSLTFDWSTSLDSFV